MAGIFRKKRNLADIMEGFYDVHCHFLPAVDDGSPDMSHTTSLLEQYAQMGVKGVYMTPHVINGVYENRDEEALKAEFSKLPARAGMDLRLAAEYFIDEKFLDHISNSPLHFSNRRVLAEFAMSSYAMQSLDMIFEAELAGYHIVLTHPERYLFVQNGKDKRIRDLINNKQAELQLNLLSLCGFHGRGAQIIAEDLLENNKYTFVGTDAHSQTYIDALQNAKIPAKYFDRLATLVENNRTILFGL